MSKADEPAFPNHDDTVFAELSGLTKREYFALHLRAGMMASGDWSPASGAETAVAAADALIAALERKPE